MRAELDDKSFSKPNWDKNPPEYYPSALTDPAIKLTKKYALETVKALYWNNWNVFQNAYGNTERNRFIDSRNWSNGRFDIQAFVGGKKSKIDGQKSPLLKHIDFDPVTEQSKYRDIVVGFLEDLDYEVLASSINPAAAAEKENRRLNELALIKLKEKQFAQSIDAAAGQPIMPQSTMQFPVSNEQELNTYAQLGGFKGIAELEIELGNSVVQNDSDWKAVKKMLLEDAFDTGRMIVDCVYDRDGRIRVKYVDPVNCGVEDYRGHGLKRPSRIWYIELKSVSEILVEAEGQINEREINQIMQQFENKFGNPTWNAAYQGWQTYVNTDTTYAYFFYNWKVPVLRAYWEEMDVYKIAKEEFSDGSYRKRWADWNENPEKYQMPEPSPEEADRGETNPQQNSMPIMLNKGIEQMQYHRYYQATWIINTDIVYDYGRVPFQSRDPYNVRYSLCPLKYYRITQQPYAERIKPYVKKIYMGWQRIDNEVAHKAPAGYEFNVNALENITLGTGETFTIKHNFEMLQNTGNFLSKPKAVGDLFGQNREDWTIRPIAQQQFENAINGHLLYIQACEDRIIKLTGINEFMDGSNPNKNSLATTANLAVQGTKNSISQMASGLLYIGEKVAMDVSERIRLVVDATGEYSGYADALGDGLLKSVTVSKAVLTHRFGIKISARPSVDERNAMKQVVAQAFANMASPEQGGLWSIEYLAFEEMISNGTNMKIVRLLMGSMMKQKLEFLQQQKMELIDRQVAGNMQSQDQAIKGKLTADQEATRLKMMYESFMTGEINKRNQFLNNNKTGNNIITQTHKSGLKIQESIIEQK